MKITVKTMQTAGVLVSVVGFGGTTDVYYYARGPRKIFKKAPNRKNFPRRGHLAGGETPPDPPRGVLRLNRRKKTLTYFEKNVKKPKKHEKTRKYHEKSVFEIVFEKFSTIRVPVFYFSFGKFVLVGEKSRLRGFRKVPRPCG